MRVHRPDQAERQPGEPLLYRHGQRELSFFSVTTVIGAPMDVTVEELAIESFYPADEATAFALG
jgi:hypothetical protein